MASRPKSALAASILLLSSTYPVHTSGAQGPVYRPCSVVSEVPEIIVRQTAEDACVKGQDIFSFLAPQTGSALAGGNVMLGEGGTLGGWGRRSAVFRITALKGYIPSNNLRLGVGTSSGASDLGARSIAVPAPSLDVAIGLFRGVTIGMTNVGGLDLLGGASFVPGISDEDFSFEPENSGFGFSYGARIGVLQESALVPGLSISMMRRQFPQAEALYFTENDTIGVSGTKVGATVLRLTVNKRFGLIGLGGGIGRDRLDSKTDIYGIVHETIAGSSQRVEVSVSDLENKTNRNTAFVNVSLGLAKARLVFEAGRSSSRSEASATLNSFGEHKPDEAYTYGSLGVGIRF